MSQQSEKTKNVAPRGPMGGHGMGAMMPGAKAKDFKGSITKLVGYLGKYKWTIVFVWILTIVSTVFTILGPKILGQATDELFTGVMNQIAGAGAIDFGKIGVILLWLAGYMVSARFFHTCRVT